MALKVTKVDVWAGEIPDEAGGLADLLAPLADAGANLECVIGHRLLAKPGSGVVFVTPIKGKRQQEAARTAGMHPTSKVATLRVEGPDQAGLGLRLAQAVADAGINMHGVSAAVIGRNFVVYLGFDSSEDAAKAARAIKAAGGKPKRQLTRTRG